jgi:hypothetical protein
MPSSPKSVAPAVSKTPSGTQSTQQDQQVQQTTQTHAHRGASSDPVRTQLLEKIDDLRKDYRVSASSSGNIHRHKSLTVLIASAFLLEGPAR